MLQPPQVDPTNGGASPAKAKFTSDILVYDEESDRHVRITWGQALEATCLAAAAGVNGKINGGAVRMSHPTTGPQGMDPNGDAGRAYAQAPGNALPAGLSLAGWLAKAKAIQSFNEQKVVTGGTTGVATYADVDTDIRIVVARPFIEHLMHSVIMAVSGRETGATLCVLHRLEPRPRALAAHAHDPSRLQVWPGGHAALGQHPSQEWDRPTFESPNPNHVPRSMLTRGRVRAQPSRATTPVTSRPSSPSRKTCS